MAERRLEQRRRTRRGRLRIGGDALYGLLRTIARHVHGFFGALAAFVSIGLLVGMAAVAVFAGLGYVVMAGATQSFDEAVLRWIASHRSDGLDRAMLEITALGNTVTVIVVLAVAGAFLWLSNHRWSVALLAVAVAGGKVLNDVLKEVYDRPRPTVVERVAEVSSDSFPSGHAMTAIIAYASVAYLVGRLEGSPRLRTATWVLATVLILAIGGSRMYLGVHYPSDILAGFIAGAAWLIFVASSVTALRFFARRRPEVRREEKDLQAGSA